jgi:UDP-N-acetylenolpyruvoylglucosamine reductase
MDAVRDAVRAASGIELATEVRLVGFEDGGGP